MKNEELLRIAIPSAAVVFAAGGLIFQLQSLSSQMDRLVDRVDANTQQVARLTVRLEEQGERINTLVKTDWKDLEKRVSSLERGRMSHGGE